MKLPQALVFDLDGTLVDSDRLYSSALRTIGIDPEGNEFLSARERAKTKTVAGHVSARNRLLYFKEILLAHGAYSHSELVRWMEEYEKALCDEIGREWQRLQRPALFRKIRARFPIALLTNETTRMQTLKCATLDPDGQLFPIVITSEEIGVEKPDPKGFRLVASTLGVTPEDCWMVGDSLSMDIEPAHRLGMTTVWTQEFAQQKLEVSPFSSYCIENLESLISMLQL